MIGKTVAYFKIQERLGGAGMSVLYRAEDMRLRSTVVLKFLPPELTRDEKARSRLVHEAQALAALDHPNICSIRSIHETPEGVFFCMPYYEGETLAARVARGPLPVREALRTAAAIAGGLDKAHSHNIVHRDVKPENILMVADGPVKILDFGIAKLQDRTKVTVAGMTPGTICYMSPEQLLGEDVDGRSDLFALGAVLYEMLTGRAPFEAEHQDAIRYRILHDQPDPLMKHRRDVPKGLQPIIDRALQKDPALRYRKASQMKADLERVLRGRQPHPAVWRTLIAAAAVLVIGAAAWKFAGIIKPTVPADKRVMVMPFASIGLDPSDNSTYDGLQQVLTTELMLLERFDMSFWVVPPEDLRKRGFDGVSEANGIFGVNLLVSGEVQSASDDYAVELTLLDAKTQRPLHAVEIAYRRENLTDLQDELVRHVADMMNLSLPEDALREVTGGGTGIAAAYENFLQGYGYMQADSTTALAVERFERATSIDSTYARAYLGLAEACLRSFETTGEKLWAERAEASCKRALAIDEDLSPALVVLGAVYNAQDRQEEAVGLFRSALELNPVGRAAYKGLAQAYKKMGNVDEAEAAYHKAIKQRPDYWPIREDLGYFYYPLGRYEDAAAQFQKLVAMTPGYYMSYNSLGAFYYLLGRIDDAQAQWEKSFSLKKNCAACGNLGLIYYRKGRYADAAGMYEWAIQFDSPHRDYTAWGNLAQAYSRMDSVEKADANFRIAIQKAEARRQKNRDDPIVTAFLAGYYADVKDREKANQRIKEALDMAPKNPEVLFRCGHAFAKLGEREKALMWIGKAIENGYPVDEIQRDPELEALRRDARFVLLLPDAGDRKINR